MFKVKDLRFEYNNPGEGVLREDKDLFFQEFTAKCHALPEKQFRAWCGADMGLLIPALQMVPRFIHDMIGAPLSASSTKEDVKKWVNKLMHHYNQSIEHIMQDLWKHYPQMVRTWSNFLFLHFVTRRETMMDQLVYTSYKLPIYYCRIPVTNYEIVGNHENNPVIRFAVGENRKKENITLGSKGCNGMNSPLVVPYHQGRSIRLLRDILSIDVIKMCLKYIDKPGWE